MVHTIFTKGNSYSEGLLASITLGISSRKVQPNLEVVSLVFICLGYLLLVTLVVSIATNQLRPLATTRISTSWATAKVSWQALSL